MRKKDPHARREAERYPHPLPSRELILKVIEKEGIPLNFKQLCDILEITSKEEPLFDRRLRAMAREGQLLCNRKNTFCLIKKLHLVAGYVQGHSDGFGFVIPDDVNHADFILSPKEMKKVMHGDRVMVQQSGVDKKGRPEGIIIEILSRPDQPIVGRFIKQLGISYVVPEDKRIHHDILILPNEDNGAKDGQIVSVTLITYPEQHMQAVGKIVDILGYYADPGMEIEIALRKHHMPHTFSHEALSIANSYSDVLVAKDIKDRKDLRDFPLITIDDETARDFDDAVYCKKIATGFQLFVAIADVSHYVRPNNSLDKEAFQRGNSVYFPRRVIPMLPEHLSNGLCSLNPEQDRLCMVCEMNVSLKGEIESYQFYSAVMRSSARMTYTKIYALMTKTDPVLAREYAWLLPSLEILISFYNLSLKLRKARGAIDFDDLSETQIIFDEYGKISEIKPKTRNDAHRLIEECMLSANICAADFLQKNHEMSLYRVHESPSTDKLTALRTFLKSFGLSIDGGENPKPQDYAKLLKKIHPRPDAHLLQTVVLRSMQQALYSPDNLGHFGLAYPAYTHFTSPIRRYPDLLVHRAIKNILLKTGKIKNNSKNNPVYATYWMEEDLSPAKKVLAHWQKLGQHCSMTERRADEATRDVALWLKCFYMQDKVGQVFTGKISTVVGFGIFVMLDDLYIEGLVHVTELGRDYFTFDNIHHRMIGERTKKIYRMSDSLTVRVDRVDMERLRVDFSLVS